MKKLTVSKHPPGYFTFNNPFTVEEFTGYLAMRNLIRIIQRENRKLKGRSIHLSRMSEEAKKAIVYHRRAIKERTEENPNYTVTIFRKGIMATGTSKNRIDAFKAAKQKLKDVRLNRKAISVTIKRYEIGRIEHEWIYSNHSMSGKCHTTSGTFLKLLKEKKALIVYASKKPKDLTKHLSYELEFFTPADFPRSIIADKLMSVGVAEYVTLKGDGSIRGRKDTDNTHELVVCVPREMLADVTAKVTKVLGECKADVNDTCGFHVHLDMRDKQKDERDRIFSNLVSAQDILFKMVPPSRKNGTRRHGLRESYCAPNTSRKFDLNTRNRYKAINACSWYVHQTIEVRLHSGTVNYEKIMRFVEIIECIANTQNKILRSAKTISGFARQFKLPSNLVNYVQNRIAKFEGVQATDNHASSSEVEQ